MRRRSGRALVVAVGLVFVLGVAALALRPLVASREPGVPERERAHPVAPAGQSGHGAGDGILGVGREAQERARLEVEPLAARTLEPELVAYGTLEEDASRSFVLRAPVAGQIRRMSGRELPGLGDALEDGEVVGLLEPRLGAMERVDLAARLASARADAEGARAALAASRAALERARILNAEDKIVSDRAVQEAEVRAKSDEARLAALVETIRTLDLALAGGVGAASLRPLVVERGGEVVEVLAHAGEVVEAGQPIVRVNRLDWLVARIALPVDHPADVDLRRARLVPFGREDRVLAGDRIALTGPADGIGRGQTVLFRVRRDDAQLRPGRPVTAYLARPGAARRGVVVPRSAIVRAGGAAWVYEQVGEERFARREVTLDTPAEGGWFVTTLPPGARIVVVGAQTLLSEEFKSQIPIGDED
jgi:multidrug efflux pump subunit AcrA (membrane-fusion protein)